MILIAFSQTKPASGGKWSFVTSETYDKLRRDCPDSAAVRIRTNDPPHPFKNIRLKETGIVRGPHMEALETSHSFGRKRKGSLSRTLFHIVNSGTVPLSIFSVSGYDNVFRPADSLVFPLILASADTLVFGVWFHPEQHVPYSATLSVASSDTALSPLTLALSGVGHDTLYPRGSKIWSAGLASVGSQGSVNTILPIHDVNGDHIEDVVAYFDDGAIGCYNGNADPEAELLWKKPPSWRSGVCPPVTIPDIDNDGYDDLVAGIFMNATALSGRTGKKVWSTNVAGYISQCNVSYDYNGDGFPDVLVVTSKYDTFFGHEGRISCLNGKTGERMWWLFDYHSYHCVIGAADFTGDGNPDLLVGTGADYASAEGFDGSKSVYKWGKSLNSGQVEDLVRIDDIDEDGIPDFAAATWQGHLFYCSAVSGNVVCPL